MLSSLSQLCDFVSFLWVGDGSHLGSSWIHFSQFHWITEKIILVKQLLLAACHRHDRLLCGAYHACYSGICHNRPLRLPRVLSIVPCKTQPRFESPGRISGWPSLNENSPSLQVKWIVSMILVWARKFIQLRGNTVNWKRSIVIPYSHVNRMRLPPWNHSPVPRVVQSRP